MREHAERHRRHVRSGSGGLDHVHGVAEGCGQDQRVVALDLKYLTNLPKCVQPVSSHVVDPADERGHVRGPDLGGQDGLGRRERERHVHWDPLADQAFSGLQAVRRHGHLHHCVGRDAGEPEPFLVEIIGARAGRLEGHRAVHFGADLLHLHLPVGMLLGQQARVGGAAGQHAPLLDGPDLLKIRGVEEQLHRLLASTSMERRTGCRPFAPFRRLAVARSTTRSMSADSAWSRL